MSMYESLITNGLDNINTADYIEEDKARLRYIEKNH